MSIKKLPAEQINVTTGLKTKCESVKGRVNVTILAVVLILMF